MQNYASRVGIALKAKYEGENISSAMPLVASTGGISLVQLYAQNMPAPNVVARALEAALQRLIWPWDTTRQIHRLAASPFIPHG